MNATRARIRAALAAVTLCGLVMGCGGGGRSVVSDGRPTPGPVSSRPVNSFEVYLQASAEGNPLFADVYGLTLNPLGVERLTSGKRISTMDANSAHVVVASADSDTGDRLGYVGNGGTILDIPGLGRPEGFAPTFERSNALLFEDVTRESGRVSTDRSFRYDERSGQKTLLMESKNISAPLVLPDGLIDYLTDPPHGRLLIKQGDKTLRSFPVPDASSEFMAGAQLAALEMTAAGSNFSDKPTDTLLLNLQSGDQRTVLGWQPLCWDPAGTKLLVRRTANTTDSELALLDPDHPDVAPQALGTIPHLVTYHGAWVVRG